MSYYGMLEITDTTGWTKQYALERNRVTVGSASFNDLVLPEERGQAIFPAHLQLFYNPTAPDRLHVLNLAKQAIPIVDPTRRDERAIGANALAFLMNGEQITLGGFTITLHLRSQSGVLRHERSQNLKLNLELPGLELRPDSVITGRLTVYNLGNRPNCQFQFDLEGLPAECYKIDPAPLLFPGAEEHLLIRFFQHGDQPPAGPNPFTLLAYAPTSYPSEAIIIHETLQVWPVYRYDLSVEGSLDERQRTVAPTPPPLTDTQPLQRKTLAAHLESEPEPAQPPPQTPRVPDTLQVPEIPQADSPSKEFHSPSGASSETSPDLPPTIKVASEDGAPLPSTIQAAPVPSPDTGSSLQVEDEENIEEDWWANESVTAPRPAERINLRKSDVRVLKAVDQEDLEQEEIRIESHLVDEAEFAEDER